MKDFAKIDCPLCNSNKFKVLYKSTLRARDFNQKVVSQNFRNSLDDFTKHGQIVKCSNCSLVYVNPQENIKRIKKGYIDVVDEEYLRMEKFRKILMRKHLKEILRFRNRGKLLDVGCFCGFFLEVAGKKFETFGIEPSTWAKLIAEKRKLKIVGNYLSDVKRQKFDVITLFDVIEHLGDPQKQIENAGRLLRKDGILVIGTPNVESISVKIFGSKHPFFVRMHIVLFGDKTLDRLLNKNGFEIVHKNYYGRTFPLIYYLEKLQTIVPFIHSLLPIVGKIKLASDLPLTVNLHDEMLVIAKKVAKSNQRARFS